MPRTFEAYRIRPDGVLELSGQVHAAALAEKDRGAFDGTSWVVDRPRADGSVQRTCSGACAPAAAEALGRWLDAAVQAAP